MPSTVLVALSGPIERAEIWALCRRVRTLLAESRAEVVVCDVGALSPPDATTIDALARLQLTVRRAGREIRVHRACGQLRELLALSGLSDVVLMWEGSDVELGRQAEEWEEVSSVQEESDPGDLPA